MIHYVMLPVLEISILGLHAVFNQMTDNWRFGGPHNAWGVEYNQFSKYSKLGL